MKKTLIVLVGALALLGIILLKKGKTEKSLSADAFVLDSTRLLEVKSIFASKKPDSALLQMKDGQWIVAGNGFPVDTAKVQKILKNIFGLQDKERVSINPERYSEYGLDSVEARHVLFKDGAGGVVADVIIGKTSGSDYSSTYWRWANKPDVYRTPGNFSWEIATKENDWKDRKLTQVKGTDLKTIDATWHDSTGMAYHYKLESVNDSTWKMLEPQDSSRVNKAMTSEMVSKFMGLNIDEFASPTDSNIAKINVDSPAVWIKFSYKDGKSMELKGSKVMDNYTYAKHPIRSDWIKLSAYNFDAFKKKPFELLDAPPVAVPPAVSPAGVPAGTPSLPSKP